MPGCSQRADNPEGIGMNTPVAIIAANPVDVEAALAAYEKDLFPRSASEAAEAYRLNKVCFGDNAPQSLVEFFTGHQPVN